MAHDGKDQAHPGESKTTADNAQEERDDTMKASHEFQVPPGSSSKRAREVKEKRPNRRRRIVILDTSLEGDDKMKSVPVSQIRQQPGDQLDDDNHHHHDSDDSSSEDDSVIGEENPSGASDEGNEPGETLRAAASPQWSAHGTPLVVDKQEGSNESKEFGEAGSTVNAKQ